MYGWITPDHLPDPTGKLTMKEVIQIAAEVNELIDMMPQIAASKRNEAMEKARELYEEQKDELARGNIDYYYYELSFVPMKLVIQSACRVILDKFGQVYVAVVMGLGAGIGFIITNGGGKALGNRNNSFDATKMVNYISGFSASMTAMAAIGGSISVSMNGVSIEWLDGFGINMSFALMFAWPLQSLKEDQARNILLRTK